MEEVLGCLAALVALVIVVVAIGLIPCVVVYTTWNWVVVALWPTVPAITAFQSCLLVLAWWLLMRLAHTPSNMD